YCYGAYELTFLRRLAKATARQQETEKVLARTLNVLAVIYAHVYFPVYCNGLKEIARHLGFAWTEPDAGGLQSMVWRRRWEASREAALKEKLLTYNQEDCEALRRVAEFLYFVCPKPTPTEAERHTGHDGHQVARVEELPRFNRREWSKMD